MTAEKLLRVAKLGMRESACMAVRALRRMGGDRPLRRVVSLVLIALMLQGQGGVLWQELRAETGGATAPEVTKFEPVNTTDLVNLSSGDFAYTIPVINVPGPEGGYPLALGYHAGIQHGEEASWVGLGWNLQPGSIARAVRGYPDDFKGVGINTNYLSNVYETYSVSVTFCFVEAGVSYTTYKGFGGSIGICASVGVYAGPFSASASVGVSVNFAPGGGVSYTASANASLAGPGFAVGLNASMDLSTGGVSLSKSAGVSLDISSLSREGSGTSLDKPKADPSATAADQKTAKGFSGGSASFGSYSGGGQHSQTIGVGFSIGVVGIHLSYTRSWLDKNEAELAYGYYYHTEDDPAPTDPPRERVNEWTMESDPAAMRDDSEKHALASGLHYLASNDGYAVMAEGSGGGLKLTRGEDRVFRPRRVVQDKWTEGAVRPWPAKALLPAKFKPRFVFQADNSEYIQPTYVGINQDTFKALLDQRLAQVPSQRLTISDLDSLQQLLLGKDFKKGSRLVRESLNGGGQFSAFDVWETDGKHYTYGEPVWHWESETLSANKQDLVGEWLRSKVTNPGSYAYAWYLSELKYPDYWDADDDGKLSDADHGGWVRFSYSLAANRYKWSSSVDGRMNDGPVNRIDALGKDKAGMMFSMQSGVKQLKYLNRIETATHVAHFITSDRKDGQQIGGIAAASSIGNVTGSGNSYTFMTTLGGLNQLGAQIDGSDNAWNKDTDTTAAVATGVCSGELVGTQTFTYKGAPILLVLNGVPVQSAGIRRIRTFTANESWEQLPLAAKTAKNSGTKALGGGTKVCEAGSTDNYEVFIDRSKQFWGNPANASQGFRDLNTQWDTKVVGKSVAWSDGAMRKLDDIYLVEKASGQLIKQVHFDYTYELQDGVKNSTGGGKLTLKALWTYGRDGKAGNAVLPPYRFDYALNPAWGDKYKYDRWGFYKHDGGLWNHRDVNGEDQAAWSLTRVTLPSGGTLEIQYEPKDYTYVQDRIPQNPRAYAGRDVSYTVDLSSWVKEAAVDSIPEYRLPNGWPQSPDEWKAFKLRASDRLRPFKVIGATNLGLSRLKSASTHATASRIPIETAPNPVDLKRHYALQASQGGKPSLADAKKVKALLADLAPQVKAAAGKALATEVDRMVTLRLGYNTGPDANRNDSLYRSALVHLVSTPTGADMTISDPTMLWPALAPSDLKVNWNQAQSTPKLGGGVRVKRVVSFDGQRRYSTSYTYTDFVDGAWTSSGVAVQEPPPFGFSAQDDRVIQTEKGGWANEGGSGIVHSRVLVRHSWTDDPYPAGVVPLQRGASAQRVTTPMGETVYRFLSPRDLPHFQRESEYAKTVTVDGKIMTNSARMTEIFNVGAWWGQLLWKEDRDALGRPLTRTENRFTQLEGYLRAYPRTNMGMDQDLERQVGNAPRPDMTYRWTGDAANGTVLPQLADADATNKAAIGQSFKTTSPGYLNASVNVTVMNAQTSSTTRRITRTTQTPTLTASQGLGAEQGTRKGMRFDDGHTDYEVTESGWHSSLVGVREMNLSPLISEIRTYGEGLRPLSVVRHTVFDRRTGASLETWQRGRRVETVPGAERVTEMIPSANGGPAVALVRNQFEMDSGDPFKYHERIVERFWPAYWVYPEMDQGPEPTITSSEWTPPAKGFGHGLSQIAQKTTARVSPAGVETFLNSKVDTWQRLKFTDKMGSVIDKPGSWFKGGEFVWNGLGADGKPPVFPEWTWTPSRLDQETTSWAVRAQPMKASNWLMAGATTRYDAFAHALEAMDGDGVFGCSRYGYPYGETTLPAGNYPIAKFGNARYDETRYFNFEDPKGRDGAPARNSLSEDSDPLVRLAKAYTGEGAYNGSYGFVIPAPPSNVADEGYEFRAFLKVADAAAATNALSGAGVQWKQAVPAEGGWWLLRARVNSSTTATLSSVLMDDVSIFPWRRNGAPASVSHYAYDRILGLVTSITGSNGRTTRYRYDGLGRLIATYDPYGQPVTGTQYRHAMQQ